MEQTTIIIAVLIGSMAFTLAYAEEPTRPSDTINCFWWYSPGMIWQTCDKGWEIVATFDKEKPPIEGITVPVNSSLALPIPDFLDSLPEGNATEFIPVVVPHKTFVQKPFIDRTLNEDELQIEEYLKDLDLCEAEVLQNAVATVATLNFTISEEGYVENLVLLFGEEGEGKYLNRTDIANFRERDNLKQNPQLLEVKKNYQACDTLLLACKQGRAGCNPAAKRAYVDDAIGAGTPQRPLLDETRSTEKFDIGPEELKAEAQRSLDFMNSTKGIEYGYNKLLDQGHKFNQDEHKYPEIRAYCSYIAQKDTSIEKYCPAQNALDYITTKVLNPEVAAIAAAHLANEARCNISWEGVSKGATDITFWEDNLKDGTCDIHIYKLESIRADKIADKEQREAQVESDEQTPETCEDCSQFRDEP